MLVALLALLAGCGPSLDAADPSDAASPSVDAASPPMDAGATAPDSPPDRSDAGTGPEALSSCVTDAPTACPDPFPRYADIAPIVRQRCATCHSGAADGPWPLDSWGHMADWQNEIRSQLLGCTMPPPDAGSSFTPHERRTILTWLRCNLPK